MTNPLLTSFILPPFSAICPEHIVPAVQVTLDHCRKTVEQILAQTGPFNWNNLCQPLADIDNNLMRVWSPVDHLNTVQNNPELRKAHEKSLRLLSNYSTWIGQHKGLYNAYRKLHDGNNYSKLSAAQKKTVDNVLRDFKLSGIDLSMEKQKRYGQIVTRLCELSSNYNNNVLDATMGWSKLVTDKQMLSGIPDSTLAIAHALAKKRKKNGWLLTLDVPSYLSVINYCDNTELREEFYYAYNTRASDQGPNAGKWDNSYIMNEIITLRYELALILGFKSYCDKSLVTKMAQNPKQVLDFLTNLANLILTQGERELMQLRIFVKKYYGHDYLKPWDVAYYSEKQKQHLFSIDDEQLRPYFPEQRVISGLFEVVNRIYSISLKERNDIDIWHPEVRFFDLFDSQGELRGSFYLDLYTRDNKRGGAWMDNCMSMMRKASGELQKPVAYLNCNFNRPIDGKQSLLTHNEVITLFHEFGHVLHHTLTCIDIPEIAGINGVPWDAVELPSQFMENFCYHPEVLALISGHYETNESLPNELLNNIIRAKNYQSAMFILRQLELSLFDFRMHHEYSPKQGAKVLEILAEVKKQVGVVPNVEWSRFPHVFSHIFAGSYAAGYYSYLWAEVLAADAWSRFEEDGIFNRETGASFLENILSRGGSEEPMVLFTRFRGRKPQLDAMFHKYGIQKYNSLNEIY